MLKKGGKKLAPLPKSESKFWEDADKHQKVMGNWSECKHYFEQTGREIVCRNCNIGYYTDGKIRVKKGHIYKGKKLVI